MLNIGDKAPIFTLKDTFGNATSIEQFLGQNVILYFYPKDNTPGCTRQAIGFSEQKSQFSAKNSVIIGISKDSSESHLSFCTQHNLDLILLSDPEKIAIQAYDVWQEKTNYGKTAFGIVRSTFWIDSKGIIQKIWRNVKVDGHIEAVIKEIS